LNSHLLQLLNQQKIYWTQRGAIKWVKFGDECTAFFHANASIRLRKNSITSLMDDNGLEHFLHDEKARDEDLAALEAPFSKEEIDSIIANLPNNKSPGHDDFNGEFLKKCWPIIAEDFYKLCDAFYEGNLCLQSINSSFITLIPKIDNPSKVGDYRPISLLNSSIKLLTKILAERLQRVIMRLIHKNQYGFIKSRSIHDCLAWAFEYLHICKVSKKALVIIKLDFEKAFDRIEHQAILEVLKHKGFGQRWVKWIEDILGSGTSSVLLNGVPGKTFHCRRGVRQGDPLSPLLFVLAADLLQTVINNAKDQGLLNVTPQVFNYRH
jgi:hypothetical protein